MSKTITINTVQGIGDLFWVAQKLLPHFDVINLNILVLDMGIVQTRAREFCSMLPKVGEVRFVKVSGAEYHRVAQTTYALPVANGDYAVNAPLERGINLRDLDGGAAIAEFVDMGLPASVERGDYLAVFVAGAKNPTLWTPATWVRAIKRLAQHLDTNKIILIGAAWDKAVQDPIYADLRTAGYRVSSHVGTMGLADSVDVIRRSRFFLGFQSGLNVIAENYDVPQAMIYFSKLRAMMFTWCKPDSVRTRFHAMTFDGDINVLIGGVPATI